jgi:peptidoglycan/LPS O-acetylase OafA/YrhL
VPATGGGFVGVDVFFVISGFVIALTLKRDLDDGRFSLAAFYERRARRILPALTIVLVGTYAAALFVAPPVFFAPFAESLSYAALFASNLHFWRNYGYFFNDSPFRPLLHTWSLAIEEQYYVVAPILLFLVFRFMQRRWALALSPLIAASLAMSVYWTATNPLANFFSLPTRVWELLLGMLLALNPPPAVTHRATREALAVVGLALIAMPVFLYSQRTPFPGLTAIPPCLGTAILIHLGAGTAPTAVSSVLAWRPLVVTGLVSYSLYLIHWPLLVFARFTLMRDLGAAEILVIVAATFATAALMYVLIERPLRRLPAPRVIVLGVATAAIAGTALLGDRGSGVNSRHHEPISRLTNSSDTVSGTVRAWREGPCLLVGDPDVRVWRKDACMRTNGDGGAILLWGDSFAAHYAPGLESAPIRGEVVQYTAQGCPPVLDHHSAGCRAFNQNALHIIKNADIRRVVLTANWAEYDHTEIESIGRTLDELRRRGVEATLIGQSPNFFMDPALIAARRGAADASEAFAPLNVDAARLNRMLQARTMPAGARFVDPMPHLCPSEPCPIRISGRNLYLDYGHFTLAGSARAVSALFPYVER